MVPAERGGHVVRPRSMKAAALALLVCALAACSGTPTDSASTQPPDCTVANLSVTVDAQLTIHVKNTARAACRLSGSPAVTMKVGRIDGPLPTTNVTLQPGQVFIQPEAQVPGAWACPGPISAGLPGEGFWTVTVQGQVVHPIDPDMQLGRQVVNCWVMTLPQGHVGAA